MQNIRHYSVCAYALLDVSYISFKYRDFDNDISYLHMNVVLKYSEHIKQLIFL